MTTTMLANELPEKMQAVVAYAPRDYRIRDGACAAGWPRRHHHRGGMLRHLRRRLRKRTTARRRSGATARQPAYIKAPMIPGHEFVGVAVELGENIARRGEFHLGERLISEQIVPCDDCRFCKSGQYWMCERHDVYGFQNNVNGAHGEVHAPAGDLAHPQGAEQHAARKGGADRALCLLRARGEPRARSSSTTSSCSPAPGRWVSGMVGAARLKNPSKLVVLDTKPERLEIAKRFGADLVMNPLKEDVVKIVKEMTGGYGCDVYIEATGHPSSVVQGLKMIRKRGRFVEFSVFGEDVTVDWSIISDRKELDLYGSHLGPYCYPFTIAAIARRPSAHRRRGHAPPAAVRFPEGHRHDAQGRGLDQDNPRTVSSTAALHSADGAGRPTNSPATESPSPPWI